MAEKETKKPTTKEPTKEPKAETLGKKLNILKKNNKPLHVVRINIIKTNDNTIMIDAKAFESMLDNAIIKNMDLPSLDLATLKKVKKTVSDIVDTAYQRIEEQSATAEAYRNNTIKQLELDASKLFD